MTTLVVVSALASIAAASLTFGHQAGYIPQNPVEIYFETPAKVTRFLDLSIEALEIYIVEKRSEL